MALSIAAVENHREREKGFIVYPVYSRRSRGLSVGINLFPDNKRCPFDCPYCEVFPFPAAAVFSLEQMETDLRSAINNAQKDNIPVKDICFSGNGEPSLSPAFSGAFKLAQQIRSETAPGASLVLITNGAGLLQPQIFSLLADAACASDSIDIWLKLDGGTPEWYKKINRSAIAHEKLTEKIKDFTSRAPVTIQTMLCAIDGEQPPETEEKAWQQLALDLASRANIRKVQLYGKARPAPEDPKASRLSAEYLEKRASSLRAAFAEKGITTPVEVYL